MTELESGDQAQYL